MPAKKYVLAGCGSRGTSMFGVPLAKDFPGKAELVGLFDINPKRMQASAETIGKPDLPQFTDFEKMLAELDFDGLVVATRDNAHAGYICKALEAGKRVISEKPLCVNAEQCRQILHALHRTGGQAFVTHNARYGPAESLIRKMLAEGAIGKVLTITFHELLDRRHGADYFRRWHRRKACSGGLLIHKASHHFDLLNWWAQSQADWLVATGGLMFYGAKNNPFHGPRCSACPHAERCNFYVDMFANEKTRKLYKEAESEDGYVRDGCVFDPEIDIEDHASVIYRYENGIQVTYTLHAFNAYEGYIISFEGTEGRLEYTTVKDTSWSMSNVTLPGTETIAGRSLRLMRPGKGIEEVEIPKAEGGHGGDWDEPPTEQMASIPEAAQAVLVGAAANLSIATGEPVQVQSLLM